jgi:glutathione S-transferase
MKLYGSLTSPFVRKIRAILTEKKVAHEFVLEDVWAASTSINTLNPLGKVPCLLLDNGKAIYDSKVISEALEKYYPTPALMPSDTTSLVDMRALEALADGIMEAAVNIFLENKFHAEGARSIDWQQRQEKKITLGCQALESLIAKSTSGYLQEAFSVADICVVCALCYVDLRLPHILWKAQYPALAQYVSRLNQRESLATTQPKVS